jgi:hypothetical protein
MYFLKEDINFIRASTEIYFLNYWFLFFKENYWLQYTLMKQEGDCYFLKMSDMYRKEVKIKNINYLWKGEYHRRINTSKLPKIATFRGVWHLHFNIRSRSLDPNRIVDRRGSKNNRSGLPHTLKKDRHCSPFSCCIELWRCRKNKKLLSLALSHTSSHLFTSRRAVACCLQLALQFFFFLSRLRDGEWVSLSECSCAFYVLSKGFEEIWSSFEGWAGLLPSENNTRDGAHIMMDPLEFAEILN